MSGYRPSGEQEVFELLNVLDDRLAHSNSAVVMATVKLFLHLTLTMPATHQQARATGAASTKNASVMGAAFWRVWLQLDGDLIAGDIITHPIPLWAQQLMLLLHGLNA